MTGAAAAHHQDQLAAAFYSPLPEPTRRPGISAPPVSHGEPAPLDRAESSRPSLRSLPLGSVSDVSIIRPWITEESPPAVGEPLGRIIIPDAGVDWMVIEGVGPEELEAGPGHMPGTAVPGQLGNAVISGHRTTHGAPFFDLDLLMAGDLITVETTIGTHAYEVVTTRVVEPDEMWVTDQWPGAWLTLTTCAPKYSARFRLVVFAKMVAGPNEAALDASPGVSPSGLHPPHL